VKTFKTLSAVAAITLLSHVQASAISSIDLSNFGSSVEALDWNWNPATSNLTGTDAPGAVLYPESFGGANLTLLDNYGGDPANLRLNLTGSVLTAPPGAFTISLEDSLGGVSATSILWSSFSSSPSTFTAEVSLNVPLGFQWNNIGGWTLDAGGTGATVNATFTELTVTAVPEPSTYALLAIGALALSGYAARRRSRK
jgi:hypothetical protein